MTAIRAPLARATGPTFSRHELSWSLGRSHRRNDLDGPGNLSEAALIEFCEFFLKTCVDQVDFMESLLQPTELLRRIQLFVEDETRAGRLPKGAFPVLREAAGRNK